MMLRVEIVGLLVSTALSAAVIGVSGQALPEADPADGPFATATFCRWVLLVYGASVRQDRWGRVHDFWVHRRAPEEPDLL